MSDFLISNLRHLSGMAERNGGQAGAGTSAGIGQPAVSKILSGSTKEPGYRTVLGLSRHFGVSVDDLLNRDLERDGPSVESQPAGLDVAKLTDLIETVEAAIAETRRPLPPRIKARFIARLYADSRAAGAGADAIKALLSGILESLEEA